MTLLAGDAAKIVIGALLALAGVTHIVPALRGGHVPYPSVERAERPFSFWSAVASYAVVFVLGLDFLASGIAHIPTLLDLIVHSIRR